MLLLTWHGTIIRLERDSGRLSHTALVPCRDLAVDFTIDLPAAGLQGELAGPNGIVMLPGPTPRTAHLRHGGRYLTAGRDAFPNFESATPGPWETLLLISESAVAVLRDVLSHSWTLDGGEILSPADMVVQGGPTLRLGAIRLDLAAWSPLREPEQPDIVMFDDPEGHLRLHRIPESAVVAREIQIAPQDRARTPDVPNEATFRTTCPARFTLPAAPEIAMPPILGNHGDRDFVYRRGWMGLQPAYGRQQRNSQIVRERDKYVLLERSVEGMILDRGGVSNEAGYIGNLNGRLPRHFGREGERYFIDEALFDEATHLPGKHVVFYGGNYQNYYHWLIDAMVPLSLLAPFLPPDATLLLPGSLARFREQPIGRLDYIEVLEAFGLGELPRTEQQGRICHVEEIWWPDRCAIGQVPAGALRAARDRALSRLAAPGAATKRIYVKREGNRSVSNAQLIDSIAMKHGFEPVMMEDLTVSQQIDLFRQAEFVLSPHGAAMANIMFCPPGTKVLELSPEYEYRPFFNEICAKLGLHHAVLPCPTTDKSFHGRLIVDGRRLNLVLNMLMNRRAA